MDIEVFGIKFSEFINAFKTAYRLNDNTYDYMAFLEIVDRASHCSMIETYNNPNQMLNDLISPTLNNIQVVFGGKKIKMKGGTNQRSYVLIIILFILGLSSVFAGVHNDNFKKLYGDDPTRWPRPPGIQPVKPEDKYLLYYINLGPEQEQQRKYQTALDLWTSKKEQHEAFQKLQDLAATEARDERETVLARLALDKLKEENTAVLTNAVISNNAIIVKTLDQLISKFEEYMKIQEETPPPPQDTKAFTKGFDQGFEQGMEYATIQGQTDNFWKGVAFGLIGALGLATVSGLIFYALRLQSERIRDDRNPDIRVRTTYGYSNRPSIENTQTVLNRRLMLADARGGKKKTRKLKKYTNKKHNRKSRR